MEVNQQPKNECGLVRIANLLLDIIADGPTLENTADNPLKTIDPPIIAGTSKEDESTKYQVWASNITEDTILLYTDGSKATEGTTSSAWFKLRVVLHHETHKNPPV